MKEILKVENVNKLFGQKQVLTNISFSIEEGDILGFIGPNGSGKTTMIKLILGLLKLNSGTITINNYNLQENYEKAIEKVGAIVENPDNYMYLSGYNNLMLTKNLYPNISKKEIDYVVSLVGLENRIHDKVNKYSLGMRQRLGIANALLRQPKLLILDEPTNGLDPLGIKDLRDLLNKLKEQGIGTLISSHNLSELESFCNKICIIDKGKIIEYSDIKDFKTIKNTYFFEVNKIKNLKNIKKINENTFLKILTKEEVPTFINDLIAKNILIYEAKLLEVTLEEAFLKRTGGSKID